MGDIEKAQLIFLDAIERRSAAVEAALSQQPASVQKMVSEASGAVLGAITQLTQAVASRPLPRTPKDHESLSPLVESVQNLHNVVVMATNRLVSEIARGVQAQERVIDELKRIERPRKWKMEIDRNYKTREVQGVVLVAED